MMLPGSPKNLRFLAVTLLLAAALLSAACVPQEVNAPPATEQPVTLILGPPASTLIPYSSVLANRLVGSLVFQALVEVDASGTPVADLALKVPTRANGGVSPDGKTVDFRLDREAQWHDGRPVTASDVVFTYGLFKSGALVTAAPGVLRHIKSVTALSDDRVRVKLSEPDWTGLLRFMPFVLPRHLLEKSGDLASDAYWDKPIGSGPYRVTKVARRRAVTLVRGAASGLPRITCVFHDTTAEQLETWDSVGRAIWPGAAVDPVGSERLARASSNRYRYWIFNVRPDRPTSSLEVRRLITSQLATEVAEADGPWGMVAHGKGDASAYQGRLRTMGWSLDKEGILKRDGQRLEVVFAYNVEDEADGYELDAILRRMRKLGVFDRRLSTFAYGDYFDRGAVLPSGDWDVARVVMPEGVPAGSAWPFDSGDIPSVTNPGGLNYAGIEDPELDSLAAELRTPHTAKRAERLRQRVGERLEEICLVIPEKRLEARVLSRGVAGVTASGADEDFMNSWRSWSVTQDSGQAGDK